MVKEPTGRFAGWTDSSGGDGFRRVIVPLTETVGLALLVAVTVTVFGLGIAAGGVYRPPFAVMVPAPVAGAIVQVTPVVVVPVTLAVNCRKGPRCTDARD